EWSRRFRTPGGKYYGFEAKQRAEGVSVPRRSIVAEIHWQDAKGKKVPLDDPAVTGYLRGSTPIAETEFPAAKATDAKGWTEVSGVDRLPPRAARRGVELALRGAPGR